MTDEEKLAERYVNGIPIFAEEGEGFSRTQMQRAFLAGLKAGRDMAEADLATIAYTQGAEAKGKRIEELEARIAELDCQKNRNKSCYSCANATEMCFRNEIGCPCGKYKSYKDENAELKNRNGELAGQKASLERWFGEAKKIIGNLYAICKDNHYLDSSVIMEQAEQFLKEIEQ